MTSNNIHRRTFLKKIVLVAVAFKSLGWAGGAYADVSGFEGLALFLTDRKFINSEYLTLTYQALLAQDNNLDQKLRNLSAAIAQQKNLKVEGFMQYLNQSKQPTLLTTAQQIIAALYTGVVGQGDQAKVINYQMALMFEPTLGVIAIPTYVSARPEYWSASPE